MLRRTLPLLLGLALLAVAQQPKSYRLPATDLRQSVIWGSQVALPDGTTLAFGGQDQTSDDGPSRTRLKVDGKWQSLTDELRKANPNQQLADKMRTLAHSFQRVAARARRAYLDGSAEPNPDLVETMPLLVKILKVELQFVQKLSEGPANQPTRASALLKVEIDGNIPPVTPKFVRQLTDCARNLREAADLLDAEPAPRALSPLVYDAKTGLVVLFGGDHLDYLTADTWVYNPKLRRWTQRHPETAPPPRANHTLKANGDGTLTLEGGYTYTSNTGYTSGQYRDHGDGPWTYDIASNKWTGGKGGAPAARTYRSGPFDPSFFLEGDKPDATAFQKRLADLAPNTWMKISPPHLPELNRDWGTAIYDPDRDLILRFSGGHSAHGGSDVLHYHLASNRWELPFFVEFPLGQLYTNTEYPEGWNLNRRPWVTGHTYQNYGYDPLGKSLVFTGQTKYAYRYDPDLGDWVSRDEKPPAMVYGSCFYTLTTTTTPHGLVCWTQSGKVLLLGKEGWQELKLDGKLPGAVVDNSTLTWDAKRGRLLFVVKPYGKPPFDGQVWSLDWATKTVKGLDPKGRPGVAELPYLCQLRYHPEQDLVLAGAWLNPEAGGAKKKMAAYDPAGNRWVSLTVGGDDPFGKSGRNVSLGMVYDPKRKLLWAVDTRSQVFVLRLDASQADLTPLND